MNTKVSPELRERFRTWWGKQIGAESQTAFQRIQQAFFAGAELEPITINELEKLYAASKTCFDPGHNLFWQNFTKAVNEYFSTSKGEGIPNEECHPTAQPPMEECIAGAPLELYQKIRAILIHCNHWDDEAVTYDEAVLKIRELVKAENVKQERLAQAGDDQQYLFHVEGKLVDLAKEIDEMGFERHVSWGAAGSDFCRGFNFTECPYRRCRQARELVETLAPGFYKEEPVQREDEDRQKHPNKAAESKPPEEHIMQFFRFSHLPEKLQEVSKPFADMANFVLTLPRNPERTVALRKLLEAKDAAVRAKLAE